MKKILKPVVLILIVLFIAIQFFQPAKNIGQTGPDHIFNKEELQPEIKEILQNACMDCHSEETRYLWYHKVAPVSWMVNNHITEGKKELNFSEWDQLDATDKIGKLDEMSQEVQRKTMPLKSYSRMHKNAKLSDEQITAFKTWTEKMSEELLMELVK